LTMPPGAYTLIVTATVNGVPGSASVGIDVVGGFQGAPTVDVDLGRPKGASYVRGEDLAITATVQFPDLSTHNDSLVVATVYLPDGTRSQAGLNNIGDNSWQGTFALSQSGHYELWVRVDPPADTGFVDGNGWERFDVLGGDLAVDPAPYPDPYPLYGKVPLTACVTYQGIPLDGALVGCEVRAPNGAVTAKRPLETYKRGCYESTFTPVASGQHVVTYTVEAFPYPPISVVRTFEVSEERSDIAFEVYYFGDDALDLADEIMQRVEQAAEAGEYYAEQRHADAVEAVADLSVGVLFLPLDLFGGSNAYLYVQDYVPGIGMIPFNLPLEALQTFAAGFVEGASAGVIKASAANLRQSPGVFYATSGNATEMWAMFGDREEVEAFIEDAFAAGETDVFSNRFVVVLQPVVDNAKDDIETQATSLALAPPPMTLPQEEAYIHDLSMRSEANRWLGPQALEYRSSFLLESYAWRQNPLVGDLAKLAEFLAWNGAKIYAAALCDGPCALMVGLFKLQEDYVANIERVNNDEQMMRLGLDLMDNGYWSERLVWANTLSALETIKQTQPPNTPQGEITEIDFRRGIREFQMGYFVWEYSMAYADITISNSGGVTADFYPVLYGHHGPGLVNWADNLIIADQFRDPSGGGDWLHSVTLEPGEERTVRLILLEDRSNSYYDDPIGINDEPRERSTTFVKLFAQTDQGVYLVESKDEKYNPQAESAKLLGVGSQLNVHYLSKPRQDWSIDSDEPQWTLPFPLQVDVGSSKDSLDYSVSILATNPFPQPMTVVISQAVPADVDLLQIRKGAASDGEIRWYKIIQPGESEVMGYDFRPAAHTLDTEIALPPVNMSFYSAAEDAIIRLSTGPRTLAIKPALYGQGTAPQHVQPGGALTARVEVTNRDVSQAHQGDLWFSLLDLNDRQVVSTALPLEVPAGNSQIYSVTLTAPITSSTYVLKGVLSHEVSTSTVLHAFVHVWEPDFSSSSPDWLGQMTVFTSTAASPIPADPLETFHWSFGDGVTSTLEHPTHVYSEPGTYTVTLMAGNAIAQQAVTDTVTVFSSPSASFESSSPDLVGQTTTFTNTTVTIPEGDPSLHYAWSFGDGITSTMEHPSHAYPSPAAYTVTLSATNVISFSTVTQVVSITDAAVAGLAVESSSPTPLGQTTYFTAWVTAGTTMLYGWNFGDGMVGQGASVSHTYPAVDVYNAVVTASNSVSLLTATTAVTITEPGFYIYLPLVLKNQ
jgi:PKD repeat protein